MCYTSDINDARQRIGVSGKALMGNLDPCCIYASNHRINKAKVKKMVDNFGAQQGYSESRTWMSSRYGPRACARICKKRTIKAISSKGIK